MPTPEQLSEAGLTADSRFATATTAQVEIAGRIYYDEATPRREPDEVAKACDDAGIEWDRLYDGDGSY